jgi:serine/threonine protein kinase/DNA-binding response OmpR family regulator
MNKKILLVEYDPPVIDTIKELLAHPIFDITTASEGESAKSVLEKKTFDMVITAAMLPKFHGFNLSKYIGDKFPETKVVIISGIYKAIEYRHQATGQYKAADFFEKPLEQEKFKARIFELLEVNPSSLSGGIGPATSPMPVVDTEQIPAIKRTHGKKDSFSSDDLFGDIIKKIEKKPAAQKTQQTSSQAEDEDVEILTDSTPSQSQPPRQAKPKPTPKLDSDLKGLLDNNSQGKDTKRFKKIEDDISRRFEETLSGLGLDSVPSSSKKKSKPVTTTPLESLPTPKSKPKPQVFPEEKYEFGNYDILGLIARGGMAEIYKAKKKGVKGFEKIIAIKKILSGYGEDDKYIEMFVDEAKIAAELTHPNIVQIYDLGKKDDFYFIAMEYVHGKDLRLLIQRLSELATRIPEELSVYLTLKVLEALGYAHHAKDSQGNNLEIVHRDISPPNILLSFGGDVKLTDFGVSKARIKMHQTVSGALKGKLLYMSPEQARGERDIDSRSDLYSVGVILYELITGEKLFIDSSEILILKRVQEGFVKRPSEIVDNVDPQLEKIILKSLAKNRWERYQSASEMITDLENYLRHKFDHMPASIHMAHYLYRIYQEEIKEKGIKVDLKALPYEIKPLSISKPEFVPFPALDEDEPTVGKSADTQEMEELEEGFEPSVEINFDEIDSLETPETEEEKIAPPKKTEIVLPEYETDAGTAQSLDLLPDPVVPPDAVEMPLDQEPATEPEDELPIPETKAPKPQSVPETFELEAEIAALEKSDRGNGIRNLVIIFVLIAIVGAAAYYFLVLNKSESQEVSTSGKTETVQPEPKHESSPPIEDTEKDAVKDTTEEKTPVRQQTIQPQENTPKKIPVQTPPKPSPSPATDNVDTAPLKVKKASPQETTADQTETPTTEKEQETPQSQDTQTTETPAQEAVDPAPQDEAQKTTPIPTEPEKPVVTEGMITADVDTQPVPLSTPMPKIPRKIMRSIKRTETVIVSYLVDHRGNVERIKFIRKSQSSDLNMLLIGSINSWKFRPAVKEGKKVKIWMTKPITIKK